MTLIPFLCNLSTLSRLILVHPVASIERNLGKCCTYDRAVSVNCKHHTIHKVSNLLDIGSISTISDSDSTISEAVSTISDSDSTISDSDSTISEPDSTISNSDCNDVTFSISEILLRSHILTFPIHLSLSL
jgi:hypothetical protein